MKVLVACERSGIVREAFRARGHEAFSCDLEGTDRPGFHIKGCVLKELESEWDLIIAHPPCTRICNSGVSWLAKRNLWHELDLACAFFNRFRDHPCKRVAIENPIPHKYAMEKIRTKYSQIIQPWMFGHGETKATCLWLKNLPPLTPSNIVSGREQRLHRLPPSKDRAKLRSETFHGIAEAMADQWGSL